MDGCSSLCGDEEEEEEEEEEVFTCRSRSLAEGLADCILQAPGSRSRTVAEGPPVRWGPLSASAVVCLQDGDKKAL